LIAIGGITGTLTGCAREDQARSAAAPALDPQSMDWEMQWAQAALQRNPNLEIVDADREARVFMVRDRHTDAVTAVQLGEVVAAPLAFLQPQLAPASVEPAPVTLSMPETPPATLPETADTDVLAAAPSPKPSPSYTIDRSGGRTKVSGTGISVVYGDSIQPTTAAVALLPESPKPYSIERSSGKVRVSGPGISVESDDQPRPAASMDKTPEGAEIEPVICEGPRVMQLDSRTLYVEGDALTARGGCELYITNSTIVASGTGVIIRDATVHINNSRIEGGLASFDAKERAKVFLRGSTLNGLSRRNAHALVQDQGGNKYQ
jgi:hypothetical protein